MGFELRKWRPDRDTEAGVGAEKDTTRCGVDDCPSRFERWRGWWRRPLLRRVEGVLCCPHCWERRLASCLDRLDRAPVVAAASLRPRLGLLLLARGSILETDLQRALAAQRRAGGGRLGEYLARAGAITEAEIMATLADNWGVAVLPLDAPLAPELLALVPAPILRAGEMLPVHYHAGSGRLHLGFGTGVAYDPLYAVEHMLGCHTLPCLVPVGRLNELLITLEGSTHPAQRIFESLCSQEEKVRIITSFADRWQAKSVRVARVGSYFWVRLEGGDSCRDLLFRQPLSAARPSPVVLL